MRRLASVVFLAALLGAAPAAALQGDAVGSPPLAGARTVTVSDGDTLWSLARRFYGDPEDWSLIYEANRALIPRPETLEAGTVLRIPPRGEPASPAGEAGARVAAVAVLGGGGGAPIDPEAPVPVRRADPEPVRRGAADRRPAVPPVVFEGAPFPLEGAASPPDSVAGPVAGETDAPAAGSARVGDRVVVSGPGTAAPGDRLQSWRPGPALDDGSRMGWPTATLTVVAAGGGRIVARIDRLHDRMAPGDRVRPLPPAPAVTVDQLEPVAAGRRLEIRAAADGRAMLGPGDWVVLGAGARDGLGPGDEFVPVDGPDDVRGGARIQVVGVHSTVSIARVVGVGSTLLRPGRRLRLDRRVR